MIINYLKLPLQILIWHNIKLEHLLFDVSMIPFILAGAFAGVVIVKLISEKYYRVLVYIMTVASCALLLL
jgi:uncharacterized membrane protein YfcA